MKRTDTWKALREMGVPEQTIVAFLRWHSGNPHIWLEFEERALALIRVGVEHFGAMAIVNAIRFDKAVSSGADEFKVNNNYAPYYARVFAIKHPQHANFFETRNLRDAA